VQKCFPGDVHQSGAPHSESDGGFKNKTINSDSKDEVTRNSKLSSM
jgi:hypothetical protein